jgi:predicted Zn-dependent protease
MSAPRDLGALARECAEWMRARLPDGQAEIYLSRGEERALARRDAASEGVEVSESLGAAVRVVRGGRLGFASSACAA